MTFLETGLLLAVLLLLDCNVQVCSSGPLALCCAAEQSTAVKKIAAHPCGLLFTCCCCTCQQEATAKLCSTVSCVASAVGRKVLCLTQVLCAGVLSEQSQAFCIGPATVRECTGAAIQSGELKPS